MSTRTRDNSISEEEFIVQSNEAFDDSAMDVLHACETYYMNGFYDEVSGDVDASTRHFYRVHRWVVITDSQGFRELLTFDNEVEAGQEFDRLDKEYAEWDTDEN